MYSIKLLWALALAVLTATAPAAAAPGAASSSPTGLDGVYRISWTEKELVAAGTSPLFARRNHSVITLTLRDGHYLIRYRNPPSSDCKGAYTVSGTAFSINFHVSTCPGGVGLVKARWSVRNGQLRFHVLRATDRGDEIAWGSKPWKKIG